MIKDGYKEFFETFKIADEAFLEFAKKSIILISQDKAIKEWDDLKSKIKSNTESVYVRSYGRNGSNNHLYKEAYQKFFQCKIEVDPSNNLYPTNVLQKLTGFNKKGKKANIRNYQVSHIFGLTKNPYAFCAPWNIAFIPKILDPFTGHESKSHLTDRVSGILRELAIKEYGKLIEEYNNEMIELNDQINEFVKNEKTNDIAIKKFHDSLYSEFSTISISNTVSANQFPVKFTFDRFG